jgi:hypothetical protein
VSIVTAIGCSSAFGTALDWLSLHQPTPNLPQLVADGSVRDDIRNSSKRATSTTANNFTVISAAAGYNDKELPPRFFSDLKAPKVEEEDDNAAQKAWLLAQYQYDDDDVYLAKLKCQLRSQRAS